MDGIQLWLYTVVFVIRLHVGAVVVNLSCNK